MRAQSRTLQHVGEWRIGVHADSVEGVFREVARVIAREAGEPQGAWGPWERVELEARDCVGLLVDWANELVGRSEAAGQAFSRLRGLAIAGCPPVPVPAALVDSVLPGQSGGQPVESFPRGAHLVAEVRGREVLSWRSPIKAATYHGATLERRGRRWSAVLVLDV